MVSTRALLALLGAAVVAYGAVAAVLYGLQRRILFRPEGTPPPVSATGVAGLQAVTLHTKDGLDLLAWWLPPSSDGRPVMLYLHGNGGNLGHRTERLRSLAAAGFGVLMPEYPGYGGNPGVPSEKSFDVTAEAALGFLQARAIRERAIVVYGESLGTGVASWIGVGRKLGAIVLESPFTSVTALAREQYWFLPVEWLVRDRFDTIGRIAQIEAPLLVALGERDGIVPPWMGRAVFAAAPEPKRLWVAADGGHEDLAQFGLLPEVVRFVNETLR